MRTVAIIQARLGSSRLPGKCLLPLVGTATVLQVIVQRLRVVQARGFLDDIVVALPFENDERTEAMTSACADYDVPHVVYYGPVNDVLTRYVWAAIAMEADRIVRITADCPLVDPDLVGEMLRKYDADYVTNAAMRTFPDGFDVEIMTRALLERVHERLAPTDPRREHVVATAFDVGTPATTVHHMLPVDRAHWRFTLDTDADYQKLRALPWHGDPLSLSLQDIITLVESGKVAAL